MGSNEFIVYVKHFNFLLPDMKCFGMIINCLGVNMKSEKRQNEKFVAYQEKYSVQMNSMALYI